MKRLLRNSMLAAILALLPSGCGDKHSGELASYTVSRGDLIDVLREVGELAPSDPLLIQAPFEGEIKWVVEDGTWVNEGEEVLTFDEEALVTQVTALRTKVIDGRQQLRLTRLQTEQARIAEIQRVENAKQNLQLAQIRHRILITPPKGGDRLIELDQEIKPIEEKLAALQSELEPLEKNFRASRAIYQEALQAWQEARSRLLEIRMGKNLQAATAKKDEGKPDDKQPAVEDNSTKTATLDPLEAAKTNATVTAQALDSARNAHEADRLPYEKKVAEIDAFDLEAQELHILIEIEKRGLPATRLAIDRDIAKLRLAEARRKEENGKRALAAGAISRSRYDQLVADAEATAGRLEVVEYRLEIESRPPDEDKVATSLATLETAQRAVDNAQEVFDREMTILEGESQIVEAELAESIGDLNRNGRGFPEAIEGTIKMLNAELELLEEDGNDRREEILNELTELKAELVEAKKNPPNILRAPSSGLLRLRYRDDRLTDVGDKWDKGHTVAMLYPPRNMRVKVGINEANFRRVKDGMPCAVEIPALETNIANAVVAHISRIGRDRRESASRWTVQGTSGIIEFALSVDMQQDVEGIRQGMTVLLEIETERREDVLYLPAAAVTEQPDGSFSVQLKDRGDQPTTVSGEFFGDDWFIVSDGLAEGATVYRRFAEEES